MGKLNGFIKMMGKIGIQALYSVGLFLIALGIASVLCFIALLVMQVGGRPITWSMWKMLLVVAFPIWIAFECYVNYHVWKLLHDDK